MVVERQKIDGNILRIAASLMDSGYKAYLVGGAVRDIIFGREPQDFDLLTDATCSEIKRLFKNVVAYGMKHGTVMVIMEKKPYEVT
ncbi:MAG TPA: polynucleotide adenylyltransferase, partial [Candidatus Wallbacteria bacterium]|nr:polynucleotide adenylyltransferase [Candidatus Wallbacteria bacterium]